MENTVTLENIKESQTKHWKQIESFALGFWGQELLAIHNYGQKDEWYELSHEYYEEEYEDYED